MEMWRTTLVDPADWVNLKGIVVASHMARRASLYAQVRNMHSFLSSEHYTALIGFDLV